MIRGWLRERRARRLRDRARTLEPAALADDVDDLAETAASADGETRALAVEALGALARGGTDPRDEIGAAGSADGEGASASGNDVDRDATADEGANADENSDDPVPERAAVALAAALPLSDDEVEADALQTLRYVVAERPATAATEHLDAPLAAAVDDWDHAVHRQVTLDAGVLLGAGVSLPQTRAALWAALDGGPPAVRDHAALAYLQVADRPDVLEDRAAVAAALREVARGREGAWPPEGSPARTLAGGRTVREAADLIDGG